MLLFVQKAEKSQHLGYIEDKFVAKKAATREYDNTFANGKSNSIHRNISIYVPCTHYSPHPLSKGIFGANEDEERVYSYHLPPQSPLLSLHLSPFKHKVKELLKNFSENLLGMVYCLNFFQKFYFLVMQGSNPLYKLQKCINKSYQPYLLKDSLDSLLFNFRC